MLMPPKYNHENIDPDQSVLSNFLRNIHDIHCLSYTFLESFYFKILSVMNFSSRFCFAVSKTYFYISEWLK